MSADAQTRPAPIPRSQKSLKLREVRFEDYPQVAALSSKFDLHTESYPGWTHLWTNNPAYLEIKDKFPMGWVLDNGEGAISGYLGNIPLNYELEGKRLLVAAGRGLVVDTPYRTYSPLLLGTYFQQPNVDLVLSTTVNAQSTPVHGIFQGIPVPVGAWDRTLFWITHYQGFMESFLRKRGGAMAKPLSYPLSVVVFLRDRLKKGRFHANGLAATVLPCASFDDRFETFWAALRKKKYNLLLAVRSRRSVGVALQVCLAAERGLDLHRTKASPGWRHTRYSCVTTIRKSGSRAYAWPTFNVWRRNARRTCLRPCCTRLWIAASKSPSTCSKWLALPRRWQDDWNVLLHIGVHFPAGSTSTEQIIRRWRRGSRTRQSGSLRCLMVIPACSGAELSGWAGRTRNQETVLAPAPPRRKNALEVLP